MDRIKAFGSLVYNPEYPVNPCKNRFSEKNKIYDYG